MSVGATRATPVVGKESIGTAVEIDVDGRWDALALSELLIPFYSFRVQRTPEGGTVYAQALGCHREPLANALRRPTNRGPRAAGTRRFASAAAQA